MDLSWDSWGLDGRLSLSLFLSTLFLQQSSCQTSRQEDLWLPRAQMQTLPGLLKAYAWKSHNVNSVVFCC